MGFNERTTGGEPVSGFGQEFLSLLGGILGLGEGGLSPEERTARIGENLSSLAEGFSPELGESIQSLVERDVERQSARIGERFGGGGLLFGGSPGANAEALFRAEAAPQATIQATEALRQNLAAILPFFGLGAQQTALATPQAQTVLQPDIFSQIGSGLLGAANLGVGIASAGQAGAGFGSFLDFFRTGTAPPPVTG